MFDRYEIGQRTTELVPYTKTVNVNNAPTVEQLRYLEEIKARVREDLLDGVLVSCSLGNLHIERYRATLTEEDEFVVTFKDREDRQHCVRIKVDGVWLMAQEDVGFALAKRGAEELFRYLASEVPVVMAMSSPFRGLK